MRSSVMYLIAGTALLLPISAPAAADPSPLASNPTELETSLGENE